MGWPENQQKHYYRSCHSPTIVSGTTVTRLLKRHLRLDFDFSACCRKARRTQTQGEVIMSGQVILYFEDQADALRFALAAGSVMAGDGTHATDNLVEETARATRIRLDAANKGANKGKNLQLSPSERVA
jgi:hypothetical protein